MSIKHLIRQLLVGILKKHRLICIDALRESGRNAIVLDYDLQSIQRYGYGNVPHRLLYNIINNNRDSYRNILEKYLQYSNYFFDIPTFITDSSASPYWGNTWFPAIDAMSLYYFLCLYNPKNYWEIGAGHSTKFARRAIKDHELRTKIISIDPQPRVAIDEMCDSIVRRKLEDLDLTIFDKIEEHDILFVDGTHQCFMNSDVTVIFMEVLPQLKNNVLVHFHDIFLPYDYPLGWEERYYSEQYLLGSWILSNPERFKIILANYFILNDPTLNQILLPIFGKLEIDLTKQFGSSFWIMT